VSHTELQRLPTVVACHHFSHVCFMRYFALVPALMLPCCLQVEVDNNDASTVSSRALPDQGCSDAPQTSSGHVPELGLLAASDRSITTLKYNAGRVSASPDITSKSGSSVTESAAAFKRGGEAEQVVPHLSNSSEDTSTSHAPAGVRPDMEPDVSAATDQQHLSTLAVHGQYVRGSGTARLTSRFPLVQGNAAQRLSAAAEPQQPKATDDGDVLTDTEELSPVKVIFDTSVPCPCMLSLNTALSSNCGASL